MIAQTASGSEIDPSMASPLNFAVSQRDGATLKMVAEAVRNKRAMLAFQPVMQARRADKPAFWEGLIRVQDGTGRTIPAKDFMSAVETHELGRELDCLALEMGLNELASEPALRLAINMSARSIGYPRWMAVLNRGLALDPTAAERLILEITECSAMLMPDIVRVFMDDLHMRGVCFALDDFGAGYTAFRYFRDFDFDILKIDGQFIQGVADSPDDQVLVRALISIAEHFEMFTVAEFVETVEDGEWLTANGIDCMQGYCFGAPTLRPWWHQQRESARRRAG
ncbi:EAL domain-containing protein [Frigidibacter sp. ROC022]|uniref:EAL domain-containing protein n=1 Tax=Frigidibacter sp. ROC022 TaxID=2971796 RepID=UPI00215A290D|nr:EAL domain-containing protein [Frigidibacter sp. ROC022]MCR8724908.1 EAL domain-containing protein [Frigidibacter sp. ROC022]